MGTYYYDIRKQVFEYDQVMINQHKAVYTERRPALEARKLNAQVMGSTRSAPSKTSWRPM